MRNKKILSQLYIVNFLMNKILPITNNLMRLPPKTYTKGSAEKLKEKDKKI